MSQRTDLKILEALERIEAHLARILPVEIDVPVLPAEPTPIKPPVPMRDRVSLIPRGIGPREPETSMGDLSQGGTDPDRFWARPDPYAHELQKPPRRMGRRFPVTR
ncbi:MAG TPA: hypothetical protein VFE48_22350 [Methylomirabilota bacterium]|nr:hypothetical protein [Methylomirabilota bacterium]